MKKLLITMIVSSFTFMGFTQEESEQLKKVKGGITLATGFNNMNSQTNLIESKGAGFDFSFGVFGDYNLNQNIAITSGLEFSTMRFSYNVNNNFQQQGLVFIDYSDKEVLRSSNEGSVDGTFRVDERTTRAMYLTLPTLIKFQTNYMGYMRYFTRFGAWNSFLIRSRGDFKGAEVIPGQGFMGDSELLDMSIPRDLSFYKGSVGITIGGEWNFAGSTSLVAELGYHYGFTNIHRTGTLFGDGDKVRSMYQLESLTDRIYRSASATPGQFSLRISVLF